MRTLLIPATAAAILATSAFAFAAQHATGTIKAYDGKSMTLTLADGSIYSLPKTFKNPSLKAGEKVSVNWQKSGSKKIADHVTLVK